MYACENGRSREWFQPSRTRGTVKCTYPNTTAGFIGPGGDVIVEMRIGRIGRM